MRDFARRKALRREVDRERDRIASRRRAFGDAREPGPEERRANDLDTDLGELTPHARRHGARFVRRLAGENPPIDRDQRLDITGLGGPMRRNQRDTIPARGLLERGAREGMQRGTIVDDTGLHCGFETA